MSGSSGLERLRAVIDGERPGPRMWAVAGIAMAEAERGRVTLRGRPTGDHTNGIGSIHGGWAATILDSAMATAVQSQLNQAAAYTTVELKISFIRPIAPGMNVTAMGKVINAGRRLMVAEGQIHDDTGRLLAHGTTTCMLLQG